MKKCQVCEEQKDKFLWIDRDTGKVNFLNASTPEIESHCMEVCFDCYKKVLIDRPKDEAGAIA